MNTEINVMTTCVDLEVMSANTQFGKIIYGSKEYYPAVASAIIDNNLEELKSILEDGIHINLPLQTTGPLAGYTVLHLASMLDKGEIVELLIENYQADVNAVAVDGAQPIHLSCLYGDGEAADILIEAGANVEAELSRDLLSKIDNLIWCEDFGDQITILTYAILHKETDSLAVKFVALGANLKVKSLTNKTLLMYAIKRSYLYLASIIAQRVQDPEFINARDDDGFPATHYLLHPDKFADGPYAEYMYEEGELGRLLRVLYSAGADIHATIDDDPYTLLLNIAAFRSSTSILKVLLSCSDYITDSKALFHATVQIATSVKTSHENLSYEELAQLRWLQGQRQSTATLILKDLINRCTFGLPVPAGEKELMNLFTTNAASARKLMDDYEQCFIQGQLKKQLIQFDNKTKTHYDVVKLCFNNRKIPSLARNKAFVDALEKSFPDDGDYDILRELISMRIEKAIKRNELLDELKKVQHLRKAIPLPYELVLETIDYLRNDELEIFVKAFVL